MKRVKTVLMSLSIPAMLFLQGCKPAPMPDFQHLVLPTTPNYYLVCPPDYCNVTPNAIAPIYPVSADDLFTAWNMVVAKQARVNYLYSIPDLASYQLVQRSYIFGFPDDIYVQFVQADENSSSIAIFSKSRYGYTDFGMNKKRIDKWLQELNIAVQQIAAQNAQNPNANNPANSPEAIAEQQNQENSNKVVTSINNLADQVETAIQQEQANPQPLFPVPATQQPSVTAPTTPSVTTPPVTTPPVTAPTVTTPPATGGTT